jgi:2-dehydropantoate 2-reductase
MEPVYIIGSGAIGKVLAVCLSNDGRKVVLLRGSVDNGETHRENISVTLSSQEIIEAEVTIDTLSNYRSLEGLVVLCNKSYGNAALADALKHKIGHSPIILLQNGLGVEQAFMDFPVVYRCVLFVTSQPASATKLNFKPVAVSPIGRISGGDETSLGHIASLLNTPYFGFRIEPDIQPVIWKKAIINSVFNSVCPLLDTDNGIFHRNPQALQIAESLVAECLCVAGEQGVNLNLAEVMGPAKPNAIPYKNINIKEQTTEHLMGLYKDQEYSFVLQKDRVAWSALTAHEQALLDGIQHVDGAAVVRRRRQRLDAS